MPPTPEITAALAERLARAEPVNVACAEVGISRSTFYRWRDEANVALMHAMTAGAENPGPDDVDPAKRGYVEHQLALDRARGRSVSAISETLNALSTIGVEKVKTVRRSGTVMAPDGTLREVDEVTTTTETVIDPATARWMAERLDPDHYRQAKRVEVTQAVRDEMITGEARDMNAALWSRFSANMVAAPLPETREEMAQLCQTSFADAYQVLFEPPAELQPGEFWWTDPETGEQYRDRVR